MDTIVNSPEIIAAIIGGAFLLLTTILGGWFNLRAAQIEAEARQSAKSSRPRSSKGKQPIRTPRKKRPLPIWLLATGTLVGTTLLIGGLALSGVLSPSPPSITSTPLTETSLPTGTPSDTPVPTDASERLGFPGNPVTANSQWQPITQTFSEIEMVLVPVGCFTMGSEDGDDDEQPAHQQCFERPFWIDRTEVTNAQYGSEGNFSGDDIPRVTVLWREAAAFCDTRGARLPTEAEWEYAARGPDSLIFPWGSIKSDIRVVYKTNSGNRPWEVGSKPQGVSWVGALDMSGNVWEWVSSLYRPYPYDPDDGRESPTSKDERVIRGGSFESYDVGASYRFGRVEAQYISVGFRCACDWSPSDPIP